MQPAVRVAAIIPALDEERTIGCVIRGCLEHVDEVLVVDGGSRDRTCEVAEASGARLLRLGLRGKGLALRAGIREVDAGLLVFIDADGSHRPRDIPRLLEPILRGEADLVVGCRVTGGSDELDGQLDHLPRAIGSRVVQVCVNLCLGARLTDIQNGFRAVRAGVARSLPVRHPGFAFDQEMSIRCLRMGYRVINVPSHEDRRLYGKSRICLWRVAPGVLWNAVTLLLGALLTRRGRRAS
jgi:dolichol-phosphate mannosyltransferase